MPNWTIARILPRTPDMRISTKEPEKATRDAVAEAIAAQRIRTPTGYGIVYIVSLCSGEGQRAHLSFNSTEHSTALTG